MNEDLAQLLTIVTTALVLLATVPVLTGLYQYLLVPFSYFHTNLENSYEHFPQISVLIPAWNEEQVVDATVRNLLAFLFLIVGLGFR